MFVTKLSNAKNVVYLKIHVFPIQVPVVPSCCTNFIINTFMSVTNVRNRNVFAIIACSLDETAFFHETSK